MNTSKRKGSVFAVLVVIVLLLISAATVTVNVIFSKGKVPQIGGYYLYLYDGADMEPDIPQNSLVFAKAAEQTSLSPGVKVLCYSGGQLGVRTIYDIQVNEDGSTSYYPGTMTEQGSELPIARTDIKAICTRASKELYQYVRFAASVSGLMALLVVPCIILIVMLLVKIARSGKDEIDEEDFMFDEAEQPDQKKPRRSKTPLFDPEDAPDPDEALEKKRSSIQDHFSSKPVNENSPYQKAVQERTMKFNKVRQEDIERARQEEAEREAQRQAEKQKAQEQQESPKKPAETAPAEPYVSSSPNIDDIIDPSQFRAVKGTKKGNSEISSSDSIDDLIALLEKEKGKL